MHYLSCFLLFIATNVLALDVKTYIPPQAYQYFPVVKENVETYMPDFEYPWYFMALGEHESCISLTHSKCLNSHSKLNTKRELGVGIFQITKAYRPDGSVRMDALKDLRDRHMRELKELSWDNVEIRADLQFRAAIIMTTDNWKRFWVMKDDMERLRAVDAAYNAGPGSVNKRRMICGMTKGCDPEIWFDNLETTVVLSTKPIYGNRSPQDINNHHVEDVTVIRWEKYKKAFQKN